MVLYVSYEKWLDKLVKCLASWAWLVKTHFISGRGLIKHEPLGVSRSGRDLILNCVHIKKGRGLKTTHPLQEKNKLKRILHKQRNGRGSEKENHAPFAAWPMGVA